MAVYFEEHKDEKLALVRRDSDGELIGFVSLRDEKTFCTIDEFWVDAEQMAEIMEYMERE